MFFGVLIRTFFFEIFLAFRYLFGKSGGFQFLPILSVIAMTLGVLTLISVMSVMNGFRHELVDSIMGVDGHAEVDLSQATKEEYDDIIKYLKESKNVKRFFPVTENQAMIKFHRDAAGVVVRGFENSDIKDKFLFSNIKIVKGDINDFSKGIFLGVKLAHKLNVKMGDSVKIISPEGFQTVIGSIPRIATYKVTGIFEIGMFEYDEVLAFLPINYATKVFRYENLPLGKIQIFLKNPFYSSLIVSDLRKQVFDISDWQDKQRYLLNALKVERNVMIFILSMIILVASFGIVSSVVCVIESKRSAIAIMRTMGMTRLSVMKVFCFSGLIIGSSGVLFGVAAGVFFATNIDKVRLFLEKLFGTELFNSTVYFLSYLPSELSMYDVVTVSTLSFLLSVIAALIPSWVASGQDPSVVLRGE